MAAARHDYFESANDIMSKVPGFMNWEANRLYTFSNYSPTSNEHPSTLANAGFFCLDDGRTLKCGLCQVQTQVSDWSDGVNPLTEHERLKPNCPIVNEYVPPSTAGPNIHIPRTNLNFPDFNTQGVQYGIQETGSEAFHFVNDHSEQMGINMRPCIHVPLREDPAVRHNRFCQNHQCCRYHHFCHLEKRRQSYCHFPTQLRSLTDRLWKYGFYYTDGGWLFLNADCHFIHLKHMIQSKCDVSGLDEHDVIKGIEPLMAQFATRFPESQAKLDTLIQSKPIRHEIRQAKPVLPASTRIRYSGSKDSLRPKGKGKKKDKKSKK